MFEGSYRRRLHADLARWQAAGVIPAAAADAIRQVEGPPPGRMGLATVIGVVGGLLIAAAVLAFVAANWTEIPRLARLLLLLAGIATAHALAAGLSARGHALLADTAACVGAIVFGATIALVGQMYHLAGDFAGGLLLWTLGALLGAALTGSRGALAVALAAACGWTVAERAATFAPLHLPFFVVWSAAAVLAMVWQSPVARHLVILAWLAWWLITDIAAIERSGMASASGMITGAGVALLFGLGLLLQTARDPRLRAPGVTMVTYGSFALAGLAAFVVAAFDGRRSKAVLPWTLVTGIAGAALAAVGAFLSRRGATALAFAACAGAMVAVFGRHGLPGGLWLVYALALAAGLCLVASGLLEEDRPRLVAGWIGLACVIAAITWTVPGTLLTRALFLACAGGAAILLAAALSRWSRRGDVT